MLNFHCCLFLHNSIARRVKLLTLERWIFSTPTHKNHPVITASSQGMPHSTSGERQSCNTFCQLLKSKTCSKHNNTNRNRQITEETRADAPLILNTNKLGYRVLPLSSACLVCECFVLQYKSFDLVKLNTRQTDKDT